VSALLELRGVSVEIRGIKALHDVTLDLDRGECLGLVGETGCGKSLTCRVLTGTLGRIAAHLVAGTARFGSTDLAHLDQRAWRAVRGRQIGFVPQSSLSSLDPVMRIGEQLREAVAVLNPSANASKQAQELVERVKLRDPKRVLRAYPHELSGGMRQRVMIALALAGNPPLLVADEPTTALDVTVQRGILDLLDAFRQESGMAVLLVTHDLAVVRSRADRIAVMYAGSVVERGPVTDVFAKPAHPYTRALLGARPLVAERGSRLTAIAGAPPALDQHPPGCPFAPRCSFAEAACEEAFPLTEQVDGDHLVRCRRWQELP
jgi:oligopeptide/dipeptide ABC transporter ATP-binding protein